MSTLAQAVKFRSLADELNDNEYNRMISRLLNLPRAQMLSWLFKQFAESKDDSFVRQLLDNAIQTTSNIILSRKKKDKENISDKKGASESLSCDLHREIASYLKQKEYFAYS